MKKRIIGALLACLLVLTCLPVSSFAAGDTCSCGHDPVILVPGLAENELIMNKGKSDEKVIWQPSSSTVTSAAGKELPSLLSGACAAIAGNYDKLAGALSALVYDVAEPLRLNADGSSYYDIQPLVSTAAESSYKALKAAGLLDKVTYGKQMLASAAAVVGEDHAFVFQYDWRLSAQETVEKLHAFVKDVETQTGHSKVDVSGTSFGCTLWSLYIQKYGAEGDLNNVLFNSPATGGTSAFADFYAPDEADFQFNYRTGLGMLLRNYYIEEDLWALIDLLPQKLINKIVYTVREDFFKKYLLTDISFWDCCAGEDYEAMKSALLDTTANAAVIQSVDELQYGLVKDLGQVLQSAAAYGTTVYIVAGEGTELITGHGVNSDGFVDTACLTGGVCAAVGQTLTSANGGRVSADGALDLTDAYLPDTTWVVHGMMHGQDYGDADLRALSLKILTGEDIQNVDSDPAYPQFMESHNPCDDVSLRLSSGSGTVISLAGGQPAALTVTVRNDSAYHFMYVHSIKVDGLPYTVKSGSFILSPGSSRTLTLVPAGSAPSGRVSGTITINYYEIPNLKLSKSRTQYFSVTA